MKAFRLPSPPIIDKVLTLKKISSQSGDSSLLKPWGHHQLASDNENVIIEDINKPISSPCSKGIYSKKLNLSPDFKKTSEAQNLYPNSPLKTSQKASKANGKDTTQELMQRLEKQNLNAVERMQQMAQSFKQRQIQKQQILARSKPDVKKELQIKQKSEKSHNPEAQKKFEDQNISRIYEIEKNAEDKNRFEVEKKYETKKMCEKPEVAEVEKKETKKKPKRHEAEDKYDAKKQPGYIKNEKTFDKKPNVENEWQILLSASFE